MSRLLYFVLILLVVPSVAAAELPAELISQWGSSGTGPGQFTYPAGVAVGPDGSVYVTDYILDRVQKFASDGTYVLRFGATGSGDGQFQGAWGIDAGASGSVYVVDYNLERVQVFDADGVFIRKWGSLGSVPGTFNDVIDVAVNESLGYVYTVERNGRRVQRFTLTGAFVSMWGTPGTGDGQFLYPVSIAIAPNGDVFVSDTSQRRVQRFDSSGVFVDTWGSPATLSYPDGIAVDADGDVLIADASTVKKYTADGISLTSWSSRGNCGAIDVFRAPGTVVDRIYGNELNTNRISYWQWWPRPQSGVSPASLNYTSVNVSTTAYDTVFVTNTGDTTLSVTDITSSDAHFVPSPITFDVAIGDTQEVQVAFSPDAYGSYSGMLTIYSNDPVYPTGRGVGVSGYTASPDIVAQPDTLWFLDTIVGTSPVDSVMVTNVGEAPLVVDSAWANWEGYVATPGSFTVAVGDTQWVRVTFTPPGHFNYLAQLLIESDDPDEGWLALSLRGSGVASDLEFSAFFAPTGLSDGGGTMQLAYTLHNLGTGNTLPFSVGVYASTDTIIDAGDELLGTDYLPAAIAPGDSINRGPLFIPAPTLRGDIYLGLIADYDETLYEIDETNNTTFAPFRFQVPAIHNVRDVPDDQGGVVYMSWYASPLEAAGGITEYSLWRAINADDAALLVEGGNARVVDTPVCARDDGAVVLRKDVSSSTTYFWELVATQPAYRLPAYGKAMPTLFDSTGTDPEFHYFQVIAHALVPADFYISAPDSARSIDNLAPGMPLNLVAAQSVDPEGLAFTWDPNTEADLSHYAVYRGDSPDFVPDAGTLLGTVDEPAFHDPDWRWDDPGYYKICAVDVHENRSPYATSGPGTVTGIDPALPPLSNYLGQNRPNPFNPVTSIEFGLKRADVVTLRIYDAAGRLVRTLADGPLPAKRHTMRWDGTDNAGRRVASGVYFCRMETGAFRQTRKMVLLK